MILKLDIVSYLCVLMYDDQYKILLNTLKIMLIVLLKLCIFKLLIKEKFVLNTKKNIIILNKRGFNG